MGLTGTMARGGVGDRTTAVVFRHLASFSELPQRKEVCTEEQVRNGKRVREIYASELASREWWMEKGHLRTVHTVTDRSLLQHRSYTVSDRRKTRRCKNLEKRSNKIQLKINCLYDFNWFPSFFYTYGLWKRVV